MRSVPPSVTRPNRGRAGRGGRDPFEHRLVVPDALTPKGWQIVAMPVAVQVFLMVCFVSSHWMMLRSRRPLAPESPAASAIAYGVFARAQSVALLVTGLVVAVAAFVVGIEALLSS